MPLRASRCLSALCAWKSIATATKPMELGLGLALCDALMQAMGGSIALEPQAAGSNGVPVFELQWPQA